MPRVIVASQPEPPASSARAKSGIHPVLLGEANGPEEDAPSEPAAKGGGFARMLNATQRGLGRMLGAKTSEPSASPPVGITRPLSGDKGVAPAAAKALESVRVVMATGLFKTAAGMVGVRLIKENAEPLRTYLTIQLRTREAAENAFAAIEDALDQGTAEQYTQGPSKRAALFLAARNYVEYERLFDEGGGAGQPLHAVPWEPTPPGRVDGWGRGLDELRFGLGPAESELLQLHHACGLDHAELAYVLGVARSEILSKLEAGNGYASLLLGDIFGEKIPKLEALFRDAYRVMLPTPEELAAAARPKVVPFPPGTVLGDRYEIDDCIGGGEFAHVYRARDVRVPGHVVALKLLHRVARTQAAREGAMRELSLIASAFHPSLIQFKDHGWYEDRLWFVMPFYDGEMLLDRIGRGPIPLDDALFYFERLARGLAALHAAGTRHQDIKPENIFLVELRTGAVADRPEILPVLLDLGVASPNGEMALAGTPMYFPPEIAGRIFDEQCDLPVTPKADVFALALSLLHSIEEPDLSDLDALDVDAFLRKRVAVVPSGPKSRALAFLRPHFSRWLAAHPNDRPTAGELADELAELRLSRQGRGAGRAMPKGARSLLVAVALTSLFAIAATTADAPSRSIEVAERAAGAEGSSRAAPATPQAEGDRVRLLRHRLETEERRGVQLEEELTRLRRRELGLPEAEDTDAPAEPGETEAGETEAGETEAADGSHAEP